MISIRLRRDRSYLEDYMALSHYCARIPSLSHGKSGKRQLQYMCFCMEGLPCAMRCVNATRRLSSYYHASAIASHMQQHSRCCTPQSARMISDQAAIAVGAFSVVDTEAGRAASFAVSLG